MFISVLTVSLKQIYVLPPKRLSNIEITIDNQRMIRNFTIVCK